MLFGSARPALVTCDDFGGMSGGVGGREGDTPARSPRVAGDGACGLTGSSKSAYGCGKQTYKVWVNFHSTRALDQILFIKTI